MTLAATVLGGAFTSRLNHLIREVKGYTYGIRGSYAMTRRFGRFEVAAGVQTAVTVPAIVDTLGEIARTQARRGDRGGAGGGPFVAGRAALGGDADARRDRRRARHAGRCTACRTTTTRRCAGSTWRRPWPRCPRPPPRTCTRTALTLVVEGDAAVIRDDMTAATIGEVVDAATCDGITSRA